MTKAQQQLADCKAASAAKDAEIVKLRARIAELEAEPTPEPEPEPTPPPPTSRPYGPSSPFNVPVDRSRGVKSNSAAIVARHVSEGFPRSFSVGQVGANDWNTAIYYADADDPVLTYTPRSQWGLAPVGAKIRCPSGAKVPQAGLSDWDGSVVIVQPDGSEYAFWQTRIDWNAKTITGNGSAYGPPGNNGTHMSSACAAGFGLRAGNLDGSEFAAGLIDHALIGIANCCDGTRVEPAMQGTTGRVCSSISKPNLNAPPLGTRFYLEASDAEINAVPFEWQRIIMRALRKYGWYIRDTGGGTFKPISNESYKSQGKADPFVEYAKKNVGAGQGIGAGSTAGTYYFTWAPFDWKGKLRVAA